MHHAERWGRAFRSSVLAFTWATSLRADPSDPQALRQVDVMLVGHAGEDPTLDDRVRSLFDQGTHVVIRRVPRLAPVAVLEPESPDTLYLWITLGPGRARVYVATREQQSQSPRYLFRDVGLETGLDEVGSETLAQVAHSSATALWAGGPETSKQELESELARDVGPAAQPKPAAPGPSRGEPVRPGPPRRASRPSFELGAGIQQAEHLAGGEGLLHEPGAFLVLAWRNTIALRALGTYLVPTHFAADPTEVRLSGASGDLRLAYLSGSASAPRIRLELGAGALFVNWRPEAAKPGRDSRPYVVGALAGELPVGPFRLGARLELRVPFRETFYDWETLDQGTKRVAASWLSPGVALEIGFPLTRF